jgi:hypothetical protein
MEVRKGFIAIIIIVAICILVSVLLGVAGWKQLGNYSLNPVDLIVGDQYIDIEISELVKYLSDNNISCYIKEEQSGFGVQNNICNSTDGTEAPHINISYLVNKNHPFHISIGTDKLFDLSPNNGIGKIVDVFMGIPYKGSNPLEARNWFWTNYNIEKANDLSIIKTISNVSFSLIIDDNAGFILTITNKEQTE